MDRLEAQAPWFNKHGVDRISTVSYTHLDVYKRQVLYCTTVTNGSGIGMIREMVGYEVGGEMKNRVTPS